MDLARIFLLVGATSLAGVADLIGVPAGASAPPASSRPSEDDVVAGLEQVLANVGEVTYEGDDIFIDGCPLVDAEEMTTATAALEEGLELAGDQLGVEMFEEYEFGETFTPVSISCDFKSTRGDSRLEAVAVIVADMRDAEASSTLGSFTSRFDPVELGEPLPDGANELFGDCDPDSSECIFGWFGARVAIAASMEFDDDTTPDRSAVVAATGEIISLVAANLARRATSTVDTIGVAPNTSVMTEGVDGADAPAGSAPGNSEVAEIHAFCTGRRTLDEYERRSDEVADSRRGVLAEQAESEGMTEVELIQRLLHDLLAEEGEAIVIHGALDDDNPEGLSELGLLYGVVIECIIDTTRMPENVLTLLDETDYGELVEASWDGYRAEWKVSPDDGVYFRLWMA